MKKINYKQKAHRYFWQRIQWYAFGFILFYAPFILFARGLGKIVGETPNVTIHDTCLRIPIQNLLSGKGVQLFSIWGISLVLLVVSALLFGPFFCGKLCPAGGFSELVSRYVPKRLKVDWTRFVNPAPVRYGFLAGFVISPFVTGNLNCSFCGFWFLENLMNAGFWAEMVSLSSCAILTGLLWLVIFGMFTKGGRGYCNFMCPVGAFQSILHFFGRMFKWTFKLKLAEDKCNNCGTCVEECPMGALERNSDAGHVQHNIHHCITCSQCVNSCPQGALFYGTGYHGFSCPSSETLAPYTKTPA
ncbi:MAG: 4Fe-4S ferredoxin [Desulfobulbus propionicus]|nr:MAG: 4Fe-4S ferredoxin [Desulfobulbus propionicus]